MRTHITGPNTKFLNAIGIMVNGIHKTANSKSLMDKFSKNTLVTVRIRLFCIKVIITRTLPKTDNRNINEYKGNVTINSAGNIGELNVLGPVPVSLGVTLKVLFAWPK